jgi:hypothetical protein
MLIRLRPLNRRGSNNEMSKRCNGVYRFLGCHIIYGQNNYRVSKFCSIWYFKFLDADNIAVNPSRVTMFAEDI